MHSCKCRVVEMARLSISSSLILTLGVLELVAPRACLSANVSFPIVLGESMCHTFKRRFMFTHVFVFTTSSRNDKQKAHEGV